MKGLLMAEICYEHVLTLLVLQAITTKNNKTNKPPTVPCLKSAPGTLPSTTARYSRDKPYFGAIDRGSLLAAYNKQPKKKWWRMGESLHILPALYGGIFKGAYQNQVTKKRSV